MKSLPFRNLHVSRVRRVRFARDDDTITFTYTMKSDAEIHTLRLQSRGLKKPTKAYAAPLPISKAKHNDLMQLCTKGTIPEYFHQEYKNINHDAHVADVLAETDEKDNIV